MSDDRRLIENCLPIHAISAEASQEIVAALFYIIPADAVIIPADKIGR